MIIDGKKIRDEILQELKVSFKSIPEPILAVVWVGADKATEKFIECKKKVAENIGVELRLFKYEDSITQEELEQEIKKLAESKEVNGIIVQLPLPKIIVSQKILELVPNTKDVDALGLEAIVLSPVVSAVKEILTRYEVSLLGKKFVVIGQGKLVGLPVATWLTHEGAEAVSY